MISKTQIILLILAIIFGSGLLPAQSIVNSVHNLSVSGPGAIRADSQSEICIFCHTPHNSSPKKPLWNRQDPGLNYTLYKSSTLQSSPGQPDGASILCLSCHDGTIALGNILSRSSDISMTGGVTVMPDGSTNLSTDLSDDHPVSLIYNTALAAANGELTDPASLTGPVRLRNEKLQCTACHDPHNDMLGDFLVATNQYSELCLYCHQIDGWDAASHKNSTASWNGTGNNPWSHTGYQSVAENACENCHIPHNAGGHARLLNHLNEEDNCLKCHNGSVASTSVQGDINKPYRHDVYNYTGIHDPSEVVSVDRKHVECVDCHNPHEADGSAATAPDAGGKNTGVPGINSAGNSVSAIRFEYELCYRCHADNADKPASPTTRQIEQSNTRLEFDINNPSFHPVEAAGQNTNVPSLIPPLSESSVIYCTACHASNGSAANGPHGSIYPQILKLRYETANNTRESSQVYALCYQCHNRNQIINTTTNEFGEKVHRKHIVGEDAPCNVCHDPHGISGSQGTSTNNTHLINFDISIVLPNSDNLLEFVDDGNYAGRCYLFCHDKNHNPENYN